MDREKKHLVLVGMMGTGKSTVGRALAQRLGMACVDTDKRIEKEQNMSIAAFFQQRGEQAFRQVETEVLQRVLQKPSPTVITTGGGIVLKEENRALMKSQGWVICLTARTEVLMKRLRHDRSRPLLQGEELSERIERLIKERADAYRAAADWQIDTSQQSIKEVVQQICRRYRMIRQSPGYAKG